MFSAKSLSPSMLPACATVPETAELATKKGVSLVAGFCWRYSNYIQATFEQVKNGAIGDIVAYYATYYTSPVKPMPPASTWPAGISDTEWQIRNWYNFQWLCGDSLVEQAVHSVDKIAWAMNDQPPVSCVAVGGRQVPAEGGLTLTTTLRLTTSIPTGYGRSWPAGRSKTATTKTPITSWAPRAPAPSAAAPIRGSKARTSGPLRARRTICISTSTTRAVRLDPQRPAPQRRQADGDVDVVGHYGPHGGLYRSTTYMGTGTEFAGSDLPRGPRLEG